MDRDWQSEPLYEERGSKKKNWIFVICAVIFTVCALLFGVRLYFTKTFGGVVVDGASMNPTLISGERLLMRPVDEKHKADYGDIIVVYVGDYPEYQEAGSPDYLIKRLIAKAGDKVCCAKGQVSVQYGGEGEFIPLDEPYAYYFLGKTKYNFSIYEVQEGEIFFLGDNRQNSIDSRYPQYSKLENRLYKEDDIVGVVPDWAVEYSGVLEFFFFPSR